VLNAEDETAGVGAHDDSPVLDYCFGRTRHPVLMRLARLHEGALVLREWHDGQLVGDFRLRLTTPEGEESWTLGPGLFGPVSDFAGQGLSFFEFQMRSWFDDHMRDLAERGLVADRDYDDLAVGYDVPTSLRKTIDG
jgi:hypothetical protein